MNIKHLIRFVLGFSIIFIIGILGLFVIHRYSDKDDQNKASILDVFRKIGGGK